METTTTLEAVKTGTWEEFNALSADGQAKLIRSFGKRDQVRLVNTLLLLGHTKSDTYFECITKLDVGVVAEALESDRHKFLCMTDNNPAIRRMEEEMVKRDLVKPDLWPWISSDILLRYLKNELKSVPSYWDKWQARMEFFFDVLEGEEDQDERDKKTKTTQKYRTTAFTNVVRVMNHCSNDHRAEIWCGLTAKEARRLMGICSYHAGTNLDDHNGICAIAFSGELNGERKYNPLSTHWNEAWRQSDEWIIEMLKFVVKVSNLKHGQGEEVDMVFREEVMIDLLEPFMSEMTVHQLRHIKERGLGKLIPAEQQFQLRLNAKGNGPVQKLLIYKEEGRKDIPGELLASVERLPLKERLRLLV